MASFLFNLGKKQEAAVVRPCDAGLTAEPGGAPAHPGADTEHSISPAPPGGSSGAPVSPLVFNAYGGEAAVTYESMNNKKQKHFSQIYINHKYLPTVTVDAKPDNPGYQKVKHGLINNAYHSLLPYVDFVMSLKGMEDREDLRRAIEIILKRFINRYWDMPAYKDSHHAYPWGFVLHCVDVGCSEAEKAAAWIPMGEHGIDEIKHARYLGMVILLRFAGGLFHDAHKIMQVQMTGVMDGYTVKFDALRNNGNVLDFKLVYPERSEEWADPYPKPGKMNAVEFLGLFPRELKDYVPTDHFLNVLFSLFDMEGSDSDRESAKRDLENAGRATKEEMILDCIKTYFTKDAATTRPENNVFKVNENWVAVVASQFLMKIRPMEGRIYTKDGVKNYLLQDGALAGTESKYETNVSYRFKLPNGKEEASKSRSKLAFIRADYLLRVYPELFDTVGQVYFDENDRESIVALCPEADCFLRGVNKKITEQPAPEKADTVATASECYGPSPGSATQDAAVKNVAALSPAEEKAALATGAEEETGLPEKDGAMVPEIGQASQSGAADPKPARESAADNPANADTGVAEENRAPLSAASVPAKSRPVIQPIRKWSRQLLYLLDSYTSEDSCPETWWIYMGIYSAYVRIPNFYKKMTNEALLDQPDWRAIAESMCRGLGEEGLLKLEPITGQIYFTPAGGGNEETTKGNFFALNLPQEVKKKLSSKIVEADPLPRQENNAYPQ